MIDWDYDKNGFPALTKHNVDLVQFIIKNDSNYRVATDPTNSKSSAYTFEDYKKSGSYPKSRDDFKEICKRIDKENVTHLSVNKGIEITAGALCKMTGLNAGLYRGDASIVDVISKFVPGRINLSFASKFCAFYSLGIYGKDNYSIFDRVLKDALPYYAWAYCGVKRFTKSKNSNLSNKNVSKSGYAGYRELIDDILKKATSITGYSIRRRDFDLIVWYYFKGDKGRLKKTKGHLGVAGSRI